MGEKIYICHLSNISCQCEEYLHLIQIVQAYILEW